MNTKNLFILISIFIIGVVVPAHAFENDEYDAKYMSQINEENQEMDRIFSEKQKYCKKDEIDKFEQYCFEMKEEKMETGKIMIDLGEVKKCFDELDKMITDYTKCLNLCDHYGVKTKGWIDCLGEEYKIKTTIISDYFKFKDSKSGIECKAASLDKEDANCHKKFLSNYNNDYTKDSELYSCIGDSEEYCQKKCFKDVDLDNSDDYLDMIDKENVSIDSDEEYEYWRNDQKSDFLNFKYFLGVFLSLFFGIRI